jgi:hypothetical protein
MFIFHWFYESAERSACNQCFFIPVEAVSPPLRENIGRNNDNEKCRRFSLLSRYQYSDNKPGPFFCQDEKPPFAVLVLSLSRHHAPLMVFLFFPLRFTTMSKAAY